MRNIFFSLVAASVALSPLYGYAKGPSLSVDTDGAAKAVNTTVTGTVVDDSGEPLPGATVILDGTRQGTSTDIDGKFSINVHGVSNPTLTISYIGMKPQSVSLASYSGKPLRISLQLNSAMMDEVVVTGYQEIKKEKMTGATTTLSAEKLDQRYSANVLDNLEGRVAGLSTYGGKPIIRGSGTLRGVASPLLVIDGVPVESTLSDFDPFSNATPSSDAVAGAIADLNPYDIESINVLKDAAAAAIYGARAANGIIVITTKNARKKGKIDIDFSANLTVFENRNVDYGDNFYMNAAQQVEAEKKYYEYYFFNNNGEVGDPISNTATQINAGHMGVSPVKYGYYQLATGEITRDELDTRLNALKKNNFARDYADDIYRRQIVQQYNLALRSSSDKARHNVTVNYKNDNSGIINHSTDYFNLSYKGSFDLAKWLTATVSFNGIYSDRKEAGSDLTANFTNIWALPAYTPYYNADGSRRTQYYTYSGNEYWDGKGQDGFHELGVIIPDEFRNNTRRTKRNHMRYHADLLFRVIDGLTINTQFLYEMENHNASWHTNEKSHASRTIRNAYTVIDDYGDISYMTPKSGGMLQTVNTDGRYWTARGQANYSKRFFDKHEIAAIAGLEFRETKVNGTKSLVLGYDDQLQSSSTNTVDFNTLQNFRTNPHYMPLVGGFPAAGAAWAYIGDGLGIIVEERHRYASGYANATYTYDDRYNVFGSFRKDYADVYGLNAKFRGKPLWSVGAGWNAHNEQFMHDLTWISFLKLRMSYGATGNIYQGATSYMTAESTNINDYTGLPIGTIVSPANPYLRWEENRTTNVGLDYSFMNYRLRGSFDFYNKSSRNIFHDKTLDPTTGFTSMVANVASIRNRGVELSIAYDWFVPGKKSKFGWTTEMTLSYNKNEVTGVESKSASAAQLVATPYRKGYPVNALWSYRFAGISDEPGRQGQTMWYDENGEPQRSVAGRSVDVLEFSGQTDPKTIIGFNNNFRWNGFSLNILMTYAGGHMMRALAQTETGVLMPYSAVNSYFVNSWTPENPTNTPGFGQYGSPSPSSEAYYSNTSVHHADFIKIRNIVFGYDVPQTWLRRFGVNNLALRFQVDNPKAIWTRNNLGVDPETLGLRNPTSYVFGLNINL